VFNGAESAFQVPFRLRIADSASPAGYRLPACGRSWSSLDGGIRTQRRCAGSVGRRCRAARHLSPGHLSAATRIVRLYAGGRRGGQEAGPAIAQDWQGSQSARYCRRVGSFGSPWGFGWAIHGEQRPAHAAGLATFWTHQTGLDNQDRFAAWLAAISHHRAMRAATWAQRAPDGLQQRGLRLRP
jgi:hypothetical protein